MLFIKTKRAGAEWLSVIFMSEVRWWSWSTEWSKEIHETLNEGSIYIIYVLNNTLVQKPVNETTWI